MDAPSYSRAESLAANPRAVRAALRLYFAIVERWGLKGDEARRLLGSPSESTYFSWKKQGVDAVSPDVMLRLSYTLGIAALLQRLFSAVPERAAPWMRTANHGPLTAGRSPLELVLEGGPVALDRLYGQLTDDAGGGLPVTVPSLAGAEH